MWLNIKEPWLRSVFSVLGPIYQGAILVRVIEPQPNGFMMDKLHDKEIECKRKEIIK